jgi:hypothetical protein
MSAGGNAGPVVSYGQLEIRPGIDHLHAHRAARRRELDGVAGQIQDDLGQPVLVGGDGKILARRRRLQE